MATGEAVGEAVGEDVGVDGLLPPLWCKPSPRPNPNPRATIMKITTEAATINTSFLRFAVPLLLMTSPFPPFGIGDGLSCSFIVENSQIPFVGLFIFGDT